MLYECDKCSQTFETEEARDECRRACRARAGDARTATRTPRTTSRAQAPKVVRQNLLGRPEKRNFCCLWCPAKFAIEHHLQRHVNAHGPQSGKTYEQLLALIQDVAMMGMRALTFPFLSLFEGDAIEYFL